MRIFICDHPFWSDDGTAERVNIGFDELNSVLGALYCYWKKGNGCKLIVVSSWKNRVPFIQSLIV
jgi:hypothetical protein